MSGSNVGLNGWEAWFRSFARSTLAASTIGLGYSSQGCMPISGTAVVEARYPNDGGSPSFNVLERKGRPIENVERWLQEHMTDVRACAQPFASPRLDMEAQRCMHVVVAPTFGALRLASTASEIVDALTPIGNPEMVGWAANARLGDEVGFVRAVERVPDGYRVTLSKALSDCPITYDDHIYEMNEDASLELVEHKETKTGVCVGRVVLGEVIPTGPVPASVGAYLADQATVEALAVDAFVLLDLELKHYGAPEALHMRAQRAIRDEARHASMVGALARRAGASFVPRAAVVHTVRSRAAVAEDAAMEGCVRETLGALLAEFQARHATSTEIARVMRSLADDELQHAVLGWAVAAWALTGVDRNARAGIRVGVKHAIERFRSAPPGGRALPEFARRDLGLPSSDVWWSWCDAVGCAIAEFGV
ncbi:MAG: ferritin-like domain-containing protein [Deltaproteobacteria bacterium]|nr:ferritin-like domain-containing protein [Deltaproteobacteria bacterium]